MSACFPSFFFVTRVSTFAESPTQYCKDDHSNRRMKAGHSCYEVIRKLPSSQHYVIEILLHFYRNISTIQPWVSALQLILSLCRGVRLLKTGK